MRSEAASLALCLALALAQGGGVSAAPVSPGLDEVRSGEMLRPVDGGYEPLPLLAMDVRIEITGTLVHGEVTQRFSNPTAGGIDAIYVFPLPERAAVDGMEMRIGDRRIVAVVKPREEAKATFEAARREGKKASLVEQERPNLFKTSVTNVGSGEEVEVRLSYLEEVSWSDGTMGLVFPLTFTPRYTPRPYEAACCAPGAFPPIAALARTGSSSVPKATIEVRMDRGSPIEQVRSSSHEIEVNLDATGTKIVPRGGPIVADRDFVLTWKIQRAEHPTATAFVEDREDGRYALVMVVPPASGTSAELGWPTDTVFVVDVSASMAGEPFEAAMRTVSLALDRLRPGDTFDIVAFDAGFYPFRDALQPVGGDVLSDAHRFVDELETGSGTEIVPAVLHAITELASARGSRQQRIILVTDGAVANEEEAFTQVGSRLGDARLHVVGIGNAPNRYLMRKLAEIGRGACTFVDNRADVATSLDSFFRTIDRPLLTDVTVAVEGAGAVDRYPTRLPDLYAGDPLFLSLRLASQEARIRLRGTTTDGSLEIEVPLVSDERPGSGVAARFGRKRIESLLDSLREGGDPDDVRARVIAVATEFHLVSPYTSLVAVEEIPTASGPSTQMRVPNALPAGVLPQTGTDGPLVLLAGVILATLGGSLYWLSRSGWARA